MRTLVATALANAKGRDVYCAARKVSDEQIAIIRNTNRQSLEEIGFTFIKLLSLDYPDVRGHAIFFEGHLDEMAKVLKQVERGY